MVMEAPSSASGTAGSPLQPSSFDTSPSQAWIDAMAWARKNSKQPEVLVNSGDSLTGIAGTHRVTLSGVEVANPQIPDPNLIYPGETVSLPQSTPAQIVAGVDDSQVKPIITDMAKANLADQGVLATSRTHDPSRQPKPMPRRSRPRPGMRSSTTRTPCCWTTCPRPRRTRPPLPKCSISTRWRPATPTC